jgi:hypothetical protein
VVGVNSELAEHRRENKNGTENKKAHNPYIKPKVQQCQDRVALESDLKEHLEG